MFRNRQEAGELLVAELAQYKKKKGVMVLGIARGGVVVAKEAADRLQVPLDILVVRKIGAPQNPELAIGAVAPEKTVYWDEELIERTGVTARIKSQALRIKAQEQKEREKKLRAGRKSLSVRGKIVIVVDDGIATGATVLCALKYLRNKQAKKIILAVPVIARDTLKEIITEFDTIIPMEIPREFYAVGEFYEEFGQVSDEEVIGILNKKSK